MKKKNEIKIFSPDIKMADLVEIDYRLLAVLSRFRIGLGFGEKTVAQVCGEAGVDADAFILICNMYSYAGYVPTGDALKAADPMAVVEYLHTSHSFYMEDGFRALEQLMDRLVEPCPPGQKKIILDFFNGYRHEVKNHFHYEETVFFPYVKSVALGNVSGDYSASKFEENHGNIEEKLSDLKNIVMKYLPSSCDRGLAADVLYALFSLSEDLQKHTNIENYVLVPIVNRLESHKKEE